MPSPMLNDITLALSFPIEIHKIKEGKETVEDEDRIVCSVLLLGGQKKKKIKTKSKVQ